MYRLLFLFTVAVASCSPANGGRDVNPVMPAPESPPAAHADSEANLVQDGSATTIFSSVGLVRIGPATYDLVFTCVDRGAGEILALGTGEDVNDKPVRAIVQAFVGEPYVGVTVGVGDEQVLFEPRLGAWLDFAFEHDVVRFSGVDFVTGLNIETGEFTPAGRGSLVVECRSYETELPVSL